MVDCCSSADSHGRFLYKTAHDSDLQYCVVASSTGRLHLVVVTLAEGKQKFNVSTCHRMKLYHFWEVPTAGGRRRTIRLNHKAVKGEHTWPACLSCWIMANDVKPKTKKK